MTKEECLKKYYNNTLDKTDLKKLSDNDFLIVTGKILGYSFETKKHIEFDDKIIACILSVFILYVFIVILKLLNNA